MCIRDSYSRVGNSAEMGATIRRLLDHPKDFPRAHLMVGDFHGRHSKWGDAMIEFQEGMRTATSKEEKAGYQKRIVGALQAQGKPTEALQELAAVLKADPK